MILAWLLAHPLLIGAFFVFLFALMPYYEHRRIMRWLRANCRLNEHAEMVIILPG